MAPRRHADPVAWVGLVAVAPPSATAGMGTLCWRWHQGADGERRLLCWAHFDGFRRLPAITVHRQALRALRAARALGEPAIYCRCDRDIPGAPLWLYRLGFENDPALSRYYGVEVMRWQ